MTKLAIIVKLMSSKKEEEITVDSSCTVRSLKDRIEAVFAAPPAAQKLMFGGRPLNDDNTLESYAIPNGAKVNLLLNRSVTATVCDDPVTSALLAELQFFLRPHYTAADSHKIIQHFQMEVRCRIAKMSLDDIERLAQSRLRLKLNASDAEI